LSAAAKNPSPRGEGFSKSGVYIIINSIKNLSLKRERLAYDMPKKMAGI